MMADFFVKIRFNVLNLEKQEAVFIIITQFFVFCQEHPGLHY